MSDIINIPPNEFPKGQNNSIPLKDNLKARFTPNIPLNLNVKGDVNRVNPFLILKTHGIEFLQAEIYKGKIPITTPDESPIKRKSKLGTAIFSDLQFTDVNGIKHVPVDTALFGVYQAKNIIRTQIQGRDGRIKEYLGEDDFEINIKGVICGDNGAYPYEQVKNLLYFLRYNQSLGIVSKFLNEIFDIQEVVISDYRFEMDEGGYSYQKFEINCYSEKPVEILIQEAKADQLAVTNRDVRTLL